MLQCYSSRTAINSKRSCFEIAAATLTKETKSFMKQTQSIVNSTGSQTGANTVVCCTGGIIVWRTNEYGNKAKSNFNFSILINTPIVQPNDATRIQQKSFL